MKNSLDLDHRLNDIRIYLSMTLNNNTNVEDYRLNLSDKLYDTIDQLISKYEKSFRPPRNIAK